MTTLRRLSFSFLCLMTSLLGLSARATPVFTDAERANLVTYWNQPGRYQVGLPADVARRGPWQVRLTPEGSTWLWNYQMALGVGKLPPNQDPTTVATQSADWKAWVQARIAYDRWQAQSVAETANALQGGNSRGSLASRHRAEPPAASAPPDIKTPAPPGPIPPGLLALAGNPPVFAAAVTPMEYTVAFEDGETLTYNDHVAVGPNFAYYRSPQGVAVYGKPQRDEELDPIFTAAGMTPSEERIMRAVSKLEGSFESINTYDTGFVSIGFIQFITGNDGKQSLIEVLQREKADKPDAFAKDFHRYGIDVSTDGIVTVVDPATGAELTGPAAVRKLIDDKRLIGVFQRAGKHSAAFCLAQVLVAKSHYWPADDPITVTAGGQALACKVSDVVASEAGIATLFDRKVNRGNIAPLAEVVGQVMAAHNLTVLADVLPYEREIIAGVKYRVDFLKDATLSQPK
ncbi:MAG TPA: hypothetical protein VKU00_04030 [Chthonomonadaceae bacterium]|nr:hypothetical protein [Chthonomonadaceae bacterium]